MGKLLDLKGGEREAHIILTSERHLRRAEITVRVFDHPMVGVAAEADQFTSVLSAVERLEKQVLKLRGKTTRHQTRAQGSLARARRGGGLFERARRQARFSRG